MTAPAIVPLKTIAYEKIKSLILSSKVVPGQKLSYSDLEKKLGISKTPIINSLSQLESEGFVRLKKNSGYYVQEINMGELK